MSLVSRVRISLPDEGSASRPELVQYITAVLEHNTVMRPEKDYITPERLADNMLYSILHRLDIEQQLPLALASDEPPDEDRPLTDDPAVRRYAEEVLNPKCGSCGTRAAERPLVYKLPLSGVELCRECAEPVVRSTEAIEAAIARRTAAASGKLEP